MSASHKNRISLQTARQSNPIFETLEDRQHFSVYTVSNTNDSGAGSLRAALLAVNAGQDNVVKFNLPKSSVGYSTSTYMWTITLRSPLPVVEKTVLIDGYSQPTFVDTPLVQIDGQGFEFAAPHTTLRGMQIENAVNGVVLDSASSNDNMEYNTIVGSTNDGMIVNSNGNVIGPPGAGNTIFTPGQTGLAINGDNNTVCGNNISRGHFGIAIGPAGDGNALQGNIVFYTTGTGIAVDGEDNLIGGYSVGNGNTILTNNGVGIDPGSDGNRVLGNYVNMPSGGTGIAQDESQAAPVIASAVEFDGKLTITGTINSKPDSNVRVELFASTPTAASGPTYDEGQIFLGYVNATTNASGVATFSDTLAYNAGGDTITATATAGNDSSGFSNAQATKVLGQVGPPIGRRL